MSTPPWSGLLAPIRMEMGLFLSSTTNTQGMPSHRPSILPSQNSGIAGLPTINLTLQDLLSAGRQTHLRAISRLRDGGLERAGWNAEEGEKLALQLGQLQVEELDGAAVLEQMVALGQAEQAQHLLGGGVRALALLGVDG